MDITERNRRIYEIRKSHPDWTYEAIGQLVGLTRQRVQQIVQDFERNGIMEPVEISDTDLVDSKPVSMTEAAKVTGVPYGTIGHWVFQRQVKVLSRPNRSGRGYAVLLDAESLRNRIARYKPRPRRKRVAV